MGIRNVALALLAVTLGVSIGMSTRLLDAQERVRSEPVGTWTVYHGAYQANNSFYVVRLNTETGETWVLDARGGAEDDVWMRLPESGAEAEN